MFASLEIGRPFGIRTAIHPTFWLLPAFVFLSGALGGGFDNAVFDTGVVLAIFGCVVLHELGHALTARQFGIGTRDIVLYPIGGVASLDRMPRSPWQEIAIALAGPAVNVVIAIGLAVVLAVDTANATAPADGLDYFLGRLLMGNFFLAAFNMIPAFPMDGGRVFRALAATVTDRVTATKLAVNAGTVFAVLFAVAGVFGIPGVLAPSPMLLLLAFFLFTTGRAEYAAVQYEEEAREFSARRRTRVPVAKPVWNSNAQTVDGWEFDPTRRLWVYWQDGHPVKAVVDR